MVLTTPLKGNVFRKNYEEPGQIENNILLLRIMKERLVTYIPLGL